MKLFMENPEFMKSLKNLKIIMLGGEELSRDLCNKIYLNSNCTVFNSYGPTESSVICTYKLVNRKENDKITIGKPLCNYKIYILDRYKKPVPIGVEGEIYIGGYGVGKGYLNRPELTKERFVENPFNFDGDEHNRIMYRTGDLGKWTSGGEIEYLGRIDFQVKINGLRIELGEIESKIHEMPEIHQCIVIDKKKENRDKYLVCYYIPKEIDNEISNKEIRKYLSEKIPRYMVPNYYIRINEIPLSSTGKLNRRKLPEPKKEDFITEAYVAPVNNIEKTICKIYSDVFNIPLNEIGRMNDFYELGGDSLNAIRILSRIEKELKIKIYIKDIMSYSKISRCNKKEFPITPQQLGIYLDSIREPNNIMYNIQVIFKLKDNIDIEKVKKGFLEIFKEQEILRSRYYEKEVNDKMEIYGYIDDECSLEFEEYTYENASSFVRPFDLSKAPLIRVGFIKNEVLLIDIHHMISDGTTNLLIMNELSRYYNDEEIKGLEIQYSDYAIYLNEKKNNGKLNDQIEVYKEIFSNEYEVLNIPTRNKIMDNKNSFKDKNINNKVYESNRYEQVIDKSTGEMINKFAKKHNISKTALFISIYGYVLSKYSGQDTIYTSVVNANRNNHYFENMTGMFVSTLPLLLKYDYNNEISFIDIIKKNMEILNIIYNNQCISIAELKNDFKLKRINNSFIYQPRFLKNKLDKNEKFIFNINDEDNNLDYIYNENNLFIKNNQSKFDIAFDAKENENNYSFSIEYNTVLYDSIMIKNILNKNTNISNIEYIPIEEKNRIIKEFNSDVNNNGCDKLYHEEFKRMAKQYPERIAIVFNEEKITYKELDEMSNSLAHYIRSQGIKRNDIIPIICDRSPYYIIGILGISKAGGAFLPIDKNLPYERIQCILEDVNPKLILFNNCKEIFDYLKCNKENIKYKIYNLEKHNYSINIEEINNINETDDLCYSIFTSGTTGKPKGTLNSHYSIYNYIRSSRDYNNKCVNNGYFNYDFMMKNENIMNILAISNFSFDASHIEILFSLIHGLKVVLVDDDTNEDIDLLSKYMIKNEVEFIQITPSRLKLLMENELFRKSMKHIKSIGLGGEELSIELCKSIKEISNSKIFNLYGPSECTVACNFKEVKCNEENKITLGRTACNYKIYILDRYMKPVPIGVEGEICIGGCGVGKGYLNRPELTKEKFIENPFNYDNDEHNRIMYRTGDLGRWTIEGEIEYLGRIDFQVKINGQRVELGEIESKVLEIPEIQQCVVIDQKKENEEKYLVCYYISNRDEKIISNKNIRKYLNEKLLRYMVPNYYIRINELPLSSTGKLNRRELPEPKKGDFITEAYVAPESDIEKVICRIYDEVFNMSGIKIGRMHDFYELGGDSLNAIRISSRIEKELKIKIYIKDIMSHSMICDLSKFIESIIKNDNNERNKMEIITKRNSKEFPITLGAILKIFEEQEILRSKYYGKEINGKMEIYGYIDDECSMKFEEYSYENIERFIRPFELDKAPLIRVGFIKNEVLLIDMHHIICDGTTNVIIMNELNKYYNDEEVETLDIQYSDYAIHLKEKKNNGKLNEQIEIYKEIF
eukprot:jgi/Orpsp1_1/1182221/evm.model.c7180000080399.2